MNTIWDAIEQRDLPKIRKRLNDYPEDVNAQNDYKDTALMLAIAHNDHELISVYLENPYLDWNARNTSNETILFKAVQIGNTDLVKYLLTEPKFAQTLQNHSDNDKYNLLRAAITFNHAKIVPLICEQFPDALCQRNQNDLTPLHSLGKYNVVPQTSQILHYLLGQPGIERSLEIKNLSSILFNLSAKPKFTPVLQVILNHYLHHSRPEHDKANKHHFENYLVQVFSEYNNAGNLLPRRLTSNFDLIARVLFYYQTKFTHLDGLYTQLARHGTPQRLHDFILDLQLPHLKQLILEDEQYQMIQMRFNLKDFGREPDIIQLATQLWYRFPFKAKNLMLHYLLVDRDKVQDAFLQGDIEPTSLIDRIVSLSEETRQQVIDTLFEKFGMTEYVEQKMLDTISSIAPELLIPHTDEQINKAFHLLREGIGFWHTRPSSVFTAKQINSKISLMRVTVKPLTLQDVIQASRNINDYLQNNTSQRLTLFDPPKKSL